MRLLIAGSRDITDAALVRRCIEATGWVGDATEIVHGGARGVDSVAHELFEGVLPIKVFPANWTAHGKAAGPIRNGEMADYADCLIAIGKADSRGTADMVKQMRAAGKMVALFIVEWRGGRWVTVKNTTPTALFGGEG